jgi:hypothetical protein
MSAFDTFLIFCQSPNLRHCCISAMDHDELTLRYPTRFIHHALQFFYIQVDVDIDPLLNVISRLALLRSSSSEGGTYGYVPDAQLIAIMSLTEIVSRGNFVVG